MFRKLFVFGIVLVLVLCLATALQAVFYAGVKSDAVIGNGEPVIEGLQERSSSAGLPAAWLAGKGCIL